jgi:hypothetical protein
MTQPKLKQLAKLLNEWAVDLNRGVEDGKPPDPHLAEPGLAEVVWLIERQVRRWIE